MSIWWIVYFQLINTNNNAKKLSGSIMRNVVRDWDIGTPPLHWQQWGQVCVLCGAHIVTKHLTLLIISWYPPPDSPPWHCSALGPDRWCPLLLWSSSDLSNLFLFPINCWTWIWKHQFQGHHVKVRQWDSGRQLYLWYHPQISPNRPEKHFLQTKDRVSYR